MLAVPGLLARALALAELEDDELVALHFADDLTFDRGARDLGVADLRLVAADRQNVVEGHLVTGGAGQEVDSDRLAFGDSVLLSARADDCIGHLRGAEPSRGFWVPQLPPKRKLQP